MPLSQAAKAPIHSAQSFFNLVFGFVRKIAEEIYARLTFQFIYCDGVIGKVVICFPFILLLCPESYGTVSHAVLSRHAMKKYLGTMSFPCILLMMLLSLSIVPPLQT